MNSVHTNIGAMVALQSLSRTNSDMATTQKAIATGFRVADAKDDGAAYAVAQRVRSNVGALTSVNQELNGVKSVIDTTVGALENVSSAMKSMKEILGKLANSNQQGEARANYIQQYQAKLQNVKDFIADASTDTNSKALIHASTTAPTTFGDISVARNEVGTALTVKAINLDDASEITNLNYSAATLADADLVKAEMAAGGSFDKAFDRVSREANTFGTQSKYIDSQVSYNSAKIASLNSSMGALVDADLSKEAANLQALQVRQQLGTQALSMANQAPQSLLSLFR